MNGLGLLSVALGGGSVLLALLAWNHTKSMTTMRPAAAMPPPGLWRNLRAVFCGLPVCRPALNSTPADYGSEYSNFRLAALGEDLGGWHLPVAAARGTILSANYYGGGKSQLLEPAREFQRLGYEVYLLDFPGAGDSSGERITFGWREGAALAALYAYAKRQGATSIVLHGVSLAAAAALRAVAAHGVAPAGVILECPFDSLLRTVKKRVKTFHLPEFCAYLLLAAGQIQLKFPALSYQPAQDAKAVACPGLVFHSIDDPYAPFSGAVTIANNFAARLVRLENLGHNTAFNDPATLPLWRREVGDFLNQLPKNGKTPDTTC